MKLTEIVKVVVINANLQFNGTKCEYNWTDRVTWTENSSSIKTLYNRHYYYHSAFGIRYAPKYAKWLGLDPSE